MKSEIQYFNSQEAAKILGVNVSTIKRWTDDGRLECIKTAGGHRKFFLQHLSHFLENNKKEASRASLFPMENESDLKIGYYVLKGDFGYLADFVLQHAILCDRNRVQQVLNGLYLGQYPLHTIYDRLLTPVLYQIGDMWHRRELSVAEEHFATQTIRDAIIRLQGIVGRPSKDSGPVLCLNFSNELHDMALKMVDHVLESRGFRVLFSGQVTLLTDIAGVFENFKPLRVYVSSTIVEDQQATQAELDLLNELCQKHGARFFVGGQGFDLLDLSQVKTERRLKSFEETYRY